MTRAPSVTRWLRAGLAALALAEAVLGAWQTLFPESFFGLRWVSYLQPYNEHLLTDVGGLNLALAVVLAAAAWTMTRPLVRAALLAFLVDAASHFAFHAFHLAGYSAVDGVGQTAALALGVIAPVTLLLLARHLDTATPPA